MAVAMKETENLLEVKGLVKHFPIKKGIIFARQVAAVRAVDGISFSVKAGETLGLVGESGCGKTTTGRTILRLIEPTSGQVIFDGKNIPDLGKDELREVRKDLQMIFQDPYSSLNPRMTVEDLIAEGMEIHELYDSRMTVGDIIGEAYHIHDLAKGKERERRIKELLEVVGLSSTHARRFPHEFSGGQRQRIGIARTLAVNPKLIVCDEPVSALDVSVQAQVVNLLQDLQQEFGLTYIFIAHDLSVVKHISDRVAVMYLGKVVELTGKSELYRNARHPYTKALLSAIPIPDPKAKKDRILLTGDVPSPINPPSGCRFHKRCPQAMDICKTKEPQMVNVASGEDSHYVACHLVVQTRR